MQHAQCLSKFSLISVWFVILTTVGGCLTVQEDFTERDCRTYILYPPRHEDGQISDRIASTWILQRKLNKCDKFINFEDSKSFITMLGGQHDKSLIKALKYEAKRARLVKRFRATHIVELTVNQDSDDPAIITKVFALSPFTEDSLGDLPGTVSLSKKDLNVITRRHPLRAYFKALNLLPNSLASGIGTPSVSAQPTVVNGAHVYDQKEVDSLPTLLSSITLRNIQHRYQYDHFDFAMSSFGSIVFNYIDNIITWTEISDPERFEPEAVPDEQRYRYRVQGAILAPVVGLDFTGYTPMGALSFGVGIGPGISTMKSTTRDQKWLGHIMIPVYLSYRAFINERFFFTLWVTVNSINPPLIQDNFLTINGRSFALMGIGYYFAESKSFIRKLL